MDEVDEVDEVDSFSERVWMCTAFTPFWLRPRAAYLTLSGSAFIGVYRRLDEHLAPALQKNLYSHSGPSL